MGKNPYLLGTDFVMFLRALVINATGLALLFVAYRAGWVAAVLKSDTFYISSLIAGLGLLGLGLVTYRILMTSKELNVVRKYLDLFNRAGQEEADSWLLSVESRVTRFIRVYRQCKAEDKPIWVDQWRRSLGSKNSMVSSVGSWLVMLGLIGTTVGIRMGVGAIDSEALLNDVLLAQLMKNVVGYLYIAFDTTIVGACCSIWLDVNLSWVLRPGTVQVENGAVEIGVLHGRT